MEEHESGGRHSPLARRLRVLRKAEGDARPIVWAKRVGWSISKLSNYESGYPRNYVNPTANDRLNKGGLQMILKKAFAIRH